MSVRCSLLSFLLQLQCWLLLVSGAASLLPHSVRIEHHLVSTHPDLVLETHRPAFDWQLADEFAADGRTLLRGITQAAYRLRVLHSGGLYWDSQRMHSNQSLQVVYGGPPFASDSSYGWQLQYWSSTGAVSALLTGSFRTALFSASDWSGQWIGSDRINMNELRRPFTLPSAAARATVFYCGLGYSELWLDGRKVDESRILDPGWTQYYKRALYVSFDLTANLTQGEHVIGIRLGDAWYSRQSNLWDMGLLPSNVTLGPPRLILQLNIQLADGSNVTVVSDSDWTGRASHTIAAGVYQGEMQDKRLERPDWSSPAYDDPYSRWIAADVLRSPLAWGGVLSLQMMDPVRKGDAALHILTTEGGGGSKLQKARIGADIRQRVLTPITESQWQYGSMFDLGQNMAGYCTASVSLPRGSSLYIRYAEYKMQPTTGPLAVSSTVTIDQTNLHAIAVEDSYVLNGSADGQPELLEPSFTYRGFRFINVYWNGVMPASSIRCPVVHSEGLLIGNFSTDNAVISQIQQNLLWSQIANTMSLMTDCPQRNERRGWMGDASGSADLSMFNFDFANVYRNFLLLISDDQDPSNGGLPVTVPNSCCGTSPSGDPNWSTAYSTITWNLYEHFGDTATMSRHYDGIEKLFVGVYNDWYTSHGLKDFFGPFYDWASQPDGGTDGNLVSAYAWLHDCYYLVQMSTVLGKADKAAQYNKTYLALAREFHSTWYNNNTGSYSNGAQTANALALALPYVVPEALRAGVASNLAADVQSKGHLTVGIIGAQQLFLVLSQTGHHDVAVALASSTGYPSYGWTFNNPYENATTIWERFSAGLDGGDSSHNHHMFSPIGSWFYRYLAGLSLNALTTVDVHPRLQHDHALLSSVHAEVLTPKGRLLVSWESQWQQRSLSLNVSIPHNTNGRLVLECPLKTSRWAQLRLNGNWLLTGDSHRHQRQAAAMDGVKSWREGEDGAVELQVLSGRYEFEGTWQ